MKVTEYAMQNAALVVPVERLEAFSRKWHVEELSLFGSVLRDDFGPDSDVDVLVTLSPNADLSLFDWVDMIAELEAVFGRKVDLVSKAGLRNPFRRREILASAAVVYRAA